MLSQVEKQTTMFQSPPALSNVVLWVTDSFLGMSSSQMNITEGEEGREK